MSKVSPIVKTYEGSGLFIGINKYQGGNSLRGCINDSKALCSYFEEKGFKCTKLLENQTKNNILSELNSLSRKSIEGERNFVIQYSGHGASMVDENGDEKDGRDEFLVPWDLKLISDDDIFQILKTFHPDSRILCIIDACHSGSILDLPYTYVNIDSKEDVEKLASNRDDTGIFHENSHQLPQKIISISGCKDNQYSMDTYSNRRREHCGALSNELQNHGDFIELECFLLKASVESNIAWANQKPCLSSSFKLDKNFVLSSLFHQKEDSTPKTKKFSILS